MQNDELTFEDREHIEGFYDGRNTDNPWPSGNRSPEYRHSFEIGRLEKLGTPMPAWQARERLTALRTHGDRHE